MKNQTLIKMEASKNEAARQLADYIITELEKHIETCAEAGEMRAFSLKLTTNCDDYTATEALKHCARWTDKNRNALIKDYVWFDSEQPDFIELVQGLTVKGIAGGLAVAALATTTAIIPAALLVPMLLIEGTIIFGSFGIEPPKARIIIFAPSALRDILRTPVRMYNVAEGLVTTAMTSVSDVATQAANIFSTVKDTADQGLSFTKNLFTKTKP